LKPNGNKPQQAFSTRQDSGSDIDIEAGVTPIDWEHQQTSSVSETASPGAPAAHEPKPTTKHGLGGWFAW